MRDVIVLVGGATVIDHLTDRGPVEVAKSAQPGGAVASIKYRLSQEQIQAVLEGALGARQDINYFCHGSVLNRGSTHYGYWVSSKGDNMYNWGTPTGTDGCQCGIDKSKFNIVKYVRKTSYSNSWFLVIWDIFWSWISFISALVFVDGLFLVCFSFICVYQPVYIMTWSATVTLTSLKSWVMVAPSLTRAFCLWWSSDLGTPPAARDRSGPSTTYQLSGLQETAVSILWKLYLFYFATKKTSCL